MISYNVDLKPNQTSITYNFNKFQFKGYTDNSPLISVLKNYQSEDVELKFSVVNILFETLQQLNLSDRNKESFYYCADFYLDEKQISAIVDNIKLPDNELVLLDLTWESASSQFGNLLIEKIKKKYKNSINVKLITSNAFREKIGNSYYCDNFFEYFCYSKFIEKKSIDHKIENKKKKFLSLNRRPDKLKLDLIKKLYEFNLIDSMYISHPEFDNFKEKILDLDLNNFDESNIIDLNIHTVDHGLRVTTPFMDFNEEYFKESYWNLVAEGVIKTQLDTVSITEKIFKPIYLKLPFIVFGQPFYLKSLRDMGYQTFDNFIDESYDLEKSDQNRLKKIIELLKKLNELDEKSFQKLYNDLQSVVEFNYNVFLDRGKNNIIGQNLINYLKENSK